ncbi:MAG: hypothetical protein GF346_13000 [Candidatus Eisenbacteria bacterium]|nr:hypothetical protein [Candidatus Latescibacterota bacterium]MBD3303356.1 hypothetical protein [Candidatus Eisenbacteria bacterium]
MKLGIDSKLVLAAGVAFALTGTPALAGDEGHDHGHEGHDHGKMKTTQAEDKGHEHDKASLRGGHVHQSEEHAFETVFADDGVRIFLYTASQAPAMVKKTEGNAVLKLEDGKSVTIPLERTEPAEDDPAVHFCPMHEDVVQWKTGVCTHCGGMKLFVQDYLFAEANLSKVTPGEAVVEIRLENLGGDESEVRFSVPVQEKAEPDSKQG